MRLLQFICFLSLLPLLAACGSDPSPGPTLDFIADTGLRTASGLVPPGDTLITRVFAQRRDSAGPLLRRFTIKVQSTFYDSPDRAAQRDTPRLYLDTVITGRRSFLLVNRFQASPLSSRETWTYTVEDADGQSTSRSYRLSTRQNDSIRVWRNYTVRLQPPVRRTSLAALAATRGRTLPAHAADAPAYQELIDILYVGANGGAPTLASPSDPLAERAPNLKVRGWASRRVTGLGLTTLTPAAFGQIDSEAAIRNAVTQAGNLGSSVPVRKDQVVAFRTADNNSGLLLVSAVGTVAPVTLTLEVKVNRQ